MKNTAFTQKHIELGAKMAEFAGYNMPIEYTGINDEHLTVRNSVGVFDVSHMGEFWVKGENAEKLVQHLTSNDVSNLEIGKAQYTCFPNKTGGIVDDLLVYKYEEQKFMLVVNAANIEKDWNWCVSNNIFDAELENASDKIGQLAIQGPKAIEVLQKLTDVKLSEIPYYSFTVGTICGVSDVIISATGYTGSGGFELYFYNDDALVIWDKIFEAGKEFGIKPTGLAARDTLRLEKGFCLYGNDIDDTTSPIEAGLGWITKFTDANDFINKTQLAQQKAEGVERKLVGFKLSERGIPRKGYEITDTDGNFVGIVTSGTMSPILKQGIGLGYVKTGYRKAGTGISIKIRNKLVKAEVCKLPFV